jgi:Uma2 family endonuclease
MTGAARHQPERRLTVEEFLAADPSDFGPAWRYELVDGVPVAQASPSDDHGAIMSNLATRLTLALEGNPDCRAETTTAAIPRNRPRPTARTPDVCPARGRRPGDRGVGPRRAYWLDSAGGGELAKGLIWNGWGTRIRT